VLTADGLIDKSSAGNRLLFDDFAHHAGASKPSAAAPLKQLVRLACPDGTHGSIAIASMIGGLPSSRGMLIHRGRLGCWAPRSTGSVVRLARNRPFQCSFLTPP
jgi:hypothetical protein